MLATSSAATVLDDVWSLAYSLMTGRTAKEYDLSRALPKSAASASKTIECGLGIEKVIKDVGLGKLRATRNYSRYLPQERLPSRRQCRRIRATRYRGMIARLLRWHHVRRHLMLARAQTVSDFSTTVSVHCRSFAC